MALISLENCAKTMLGESGEKEGFWTVKRQSELSTEGQTVPGFGSWLLACSLGNTAVVPNPRQGFEESAPMILEQDFV